MFLPPKMPCGGWKAHRSFTNYFNVRCVGRFHQWCSLIPSTNEGCAPHLMEVFVIGVCLAVWQWCSLITHNERRF
ncbi:MAG: hypothetical protein IJX23_01355 [Clostridia bacterium]|nr:hypothetical protein [Clostridia bacterium]